MKAYMVWVENSYKGCGVVFAETANKARQEAQWLDCCLDEQYIDIRAKRLPLLDGLENEEPKDNLWLSEKIRLILVRDYTWTCIEPFVEDCSTCCAKEFCEYGESSS